MLKYFNKIVLYLLIFSSVFAQENSDSYKIGIDYKSKIRVKNLTPDTRDALQNIIEVAFSRILQQTIDLNWPISFDEVAQSKFEAVLKEQKRAENLEDCIDSSCAIELGRAAQEIGRAHV